MIARRAAAHNPQCLHADYMHVYYIKMYRPDNQRKRENRQTAMLAIARVSLDLQLLQARRCFAGSALCSSL